MANSDTPHGFTVMAPVCPLQPYSVDASNGTAFFIGDHTIMESDGNVAPSTDGSETVGIGATTSVLAASTAGTVLVHDDKDQRFYVQGVSGTAATQTMIGNASDTSVSAGNANTNISGHELLISTLSTSVGQWAIHDMLALVGQTLAEHAEIVVKPNEHLNAVVAGV